MREIIENRGVFTVVGGGLKLRGTYHRPPDMSSDVPVGRNGHKRLGVLFLNSGFQPRTAAGDASVYWADSFARIGYPSFRIDLPGLGDSDGDLPAELRDFISLVNAGRYAPILASASENLAKRFNLSGVVIVGNCAGATSGIFTAAASKTVKGVVVLDPYFHHGHPEGGNIRKGFRQLLPRSRAAGYLSSMYGYLKLFGRIVRKNPLPHNANFLLVRCWRQLASEGLPILTLVVPSADTRIGEFDYLNYAQRASAKQQIEVHVVEGTNHAFVKGTGKETVRKLTEDWLRAHFGSASGEQGEMADSAAPPTMELTETVDSLAG